MPNYTLIKNTHIVDTEARTAELGSILMRRGNGGKPGGIEAVWYGTGLPDRLPEGCEVYDARGALSMPAFIDMHCHLREPGEEEKETIYTGTAAAVAGGFGTVVAMPNTKPPIDSVERLRWVIDRARVWGLCEVLPTAAITVGQQGRELCDFDALHEAGAVAFTDDGMPVSDAGLMREAMKRCAKGGYLIISHCEELSLSAGGVMNEGRTAAALGVKGIPNSAEDVAIARDLLLAEETGCRLHIAHVSTAGGMRMIRDAKARGVNVTVETCPHYFSLCDEDVMFYGGNAKMNPSLRSRADVEAVIEAIVDGTVDCISTDHAPHTEKQKTGPLAEVNNGIIGLQTAFAAAVTYLVMPGHIDIFRLCELLCTGPAKILGRKIEIKPGAKNGIAVTNPNREIVVSRSMLKSKSCNTPFIGLSLYGAVERVFLP
ncbi:MAG: dihydroorotase [Eubacteriales bacterium]|jgi:dihydroorotase|nr:dihydroorotase [Clostridiales bacterium]